MYIYIYEYIYKTFLRFDVKIYLKNNVDDLRYSVEVVRCKILKFLLPIFMQTVKKQLLN